MHSKLNMQKVAVTPHVRLSRLQELQLAKNINAFTRAKRVVCVCVCVCVFCLSVCVFLCVFLLWRGKREDPSCSSAVQTGEGLSG